MQWPSPPYGVYAEFILTVLATMALLQYVGVSGSAGEFGLAFLVGTGCMLPSRLRCLRDRRLSGLLVEEGGSALSYAELIYTQ